MKKKILTLAAIAICASVAASGTLAYFNASDVAHNVITSGGVTIDVIEKMNPKEGVAFEELDDFENQTGVMPGEDISKIVAIKNIGADDAWIRVKVDTVIHKNPMISAFNEFLPLEADGVQMITYHKELEDKQWAEVSDHYDVDDYVADIANWGNDWVEFGPYFYYTKPVAVGELTTTLFDKVHFAEQMSNEYQNCRVEIDVEAEAIQVAHNELVEGEPITSAWPEYWTADAGENN